MEAVKEQIGYTFSKRHEIIQRENNLGPLNDKEQKEKKRCKYVLIQRKFTKGKINFKALQSKKYSHVQI